jgi:uncharacterized protein (DUF1330 family)
VSAVHASAKLPAFTIAEIEVTDPQAFQTFAKMNIEQINAAGGRFLAQRGRTVAQSGEAPKSVTLIAWDSLDQATAYFNSLPFKELQPLRDKAAKVRNFHVEGVAR